jgi:tetratricopeptide (TPR) repeat protein
VLKDSGLLGFVAWSAKGAKSMPIRPEDFDASPRRADIAHKLAAAADGLLAKPEPAEKTDINWVRRNKTLMLGGGATLFALTLLAASWLSSNWVTPASEEKSRNSLDEIQIVAMLMGTESSPYIARLVRQKGISFNPAEHLLNKLRQATAEDVLIDELRRAKRFKPPSSHAAISESALGHLFSGAEYQMANKYSAAEQEFRAAVDLEPTNMALYLPLGRCLLDQERLDEAIATYRKAIDLDPVSPVAHSDLGNALEAKGSLDAAIAEQRVAIGLNPEYADAHGNLARELMGKRDFEGGLAEYREAIRVQPDLLSWRMSLANDLRGNGHVAEAIAECQEAIRLKPDYAPAHMQLGMSFGVNKDWDQAVAEETVAVQLKPELAPAHNELGVALTWKGDWDRAGSEFRQAIGLVPNWAQAHHNLGLALENKQDFRAALDEYNRAYQLDPQDRSALSDYQRMLKKIKTYR